MASVNWCQHQFRWWLGAFLHKAITKTNTDLLSMGSLGSSIWRQYKNSVLKCSYLWQVDRHWVLWMNWLLGIIVGIDHVFCSRSRGWTRAPPCTSGVACCSACSAEPGDPTSAWWRVQPRFLMQKHGQFPFCHDHLGRSNQTIHFLKQNYPQLNGYHQLQVDNAFLREYVAMHACWRHNGRWM